MCCCVNKHLKREIPEISKPLLKPEQCAIKFTTFKENKDDKDNKQFSKKGWICQDFSYWLGDIPDEVNRQEKVCEDECKYCREKNKKSKERIEVFSQKKQRNVTLEYETIRRNETSILIEDTDPKTNTKFNWCCCPADQNIYKAPAQSRLMRVSRKIR
jgi:hypothetical protein